MTYAFSASEVEDGTGKSTAIVFEQPATSIAWLNDRGLTAFSSATDANQKAYSLRSTEEAQDILLNLGYRGRRSNDDQGLLFPAWKAYSQEGEHLDADVVPEEFLEARRLIEEKMAGSKWMIGRSAGLVSEMPHGLSTARVKFRGSGTVNSLQSNHPEIASRLRRVLPSTWSPFS